jgi:hypothetical protein
MGLICNERFSSLYHQDYQIPTKKYMINKKNFSRLLVILHTLQSRTSFNVSLEQKLSSSSNILFFYLKFCFSLLKTIRKIFSIFTFPIFFHFNKTSSTGTSS